MESLAAMLQPRERSMGWVCAPTYDLAEKVFREVAIIAAEHLRHRIVVLKEHEKRLVLRNMTGGLSELRGKSADNPVSLLGEGLDYLIVDEAAQLKPLIWQSYLSQRLIDRQGWALLISTPRGKGWFFDLFRRGQAGIDRDFASWNLPSWTNPYLDRALIDVERDRIPDRVFQQEYGGEFIEGAGQVFRNVRECAVGGFQEPVKGQVYVAGLDLAKVADYTVLVVVNMKAEVVHIDRFNRLDWHLQLPRIRAALDRFNRARVLVDSTGAGEPIYEALRVEGVNAVPYTLTAKGKTAIVDNLLLMLEKRSIVLPRPELSPELIDELESFEYSVTDSGNIRSGAPSGIHDDIVIALALAAWEVRPSAPAGFMPRAVLRSAVRDELENIESWSPLSKIHFDSTEPLLLQPGWRNPRPEMAVYVHGDLALSGCRAALAGLRATGEFLKLAPDESDYGLATMPEAELAFLVAIQGSSENQVDLAEFLRLVSCLMAAGIRIRRISFDEFAAADLIQRLRGMGIPSSLRSVDREPAAYVSLRTALAKGALKIPPEPLLLRELSGLVHDDRKGRIDHESGGSKDLTDALAGAYANLLDDAAQLQSARILNELLECMLADEDVEDERRAHPPIDVFSRYEREDERRREMGEDLGRSLPFSPFSPFSPFGPRGPIGGL